MGFVFRLVGLMLTLSVLAACANREYTPTVPNALTIGDPFPVFAVTNRIQEPNGNFGHLRAEDLSLLELTVSIPPNREPGTLKFGYTKPNPRVHFAMANREKFASEAEFRTRLNQTLQQFPGDSREITVFVHGYNATQSETAYRAAQMAKDINLPGAVVIYSWPSRGKALGYAYDTDSMLFARDGLERLLRMLSSTGAKRIVLVGHSMGSLLTMEVLRQIDIRDPGWAARKLGGVLLISPDVDVDVFRTQILGLSRVPQPFVVLVSQKDQILNLSARLRGTAASKRLGSISNLAAVSDLPISVIDLTAFRDEAESGHFIPASSPTLLAMLGRVATVGSTFQPEDLTLGAILAGRPESGISARKIIASPSDAGFR